VPVRLVLVMVTSNSYDLGVTANTLQYIIPWPGDQDTAHYTTLEEPQVPQHRFPKQRSSQSVSLAGISSNLQAARSIDPASPQSIYTSRSTAAASRGDACRSESFSVLRCIVWRRAKPCQLHRQDLLGDHRSSSPGSAVHWPGLSSINQHFLFDNSGIAWRRLQVRVVLRSPLHRMAQSETLSASSTGSAGRPSLEQPRQRGPLARPLPNPSVKSSRSTAAASRGVAYSSECPPRSPLHRMAQSESLSSSSTVAAERSSL